jgi:hypothetical protein
VGVGWLFPLVLLAVIAAGLAVTVTTARHRRRLLRRLEIVISTGLPVATIQEPARGIRVQRPQGSHLNRSALLLRVPQDLPLAHVIPPG